MRKRIIGILLSASFLALVIVFNRNTHEEVKNVKMELNIEESVIPYRMLHSVSYAQEQEEIREEIRLGEIELLAQLIQAEAGNQDETGKRYVADVVLNRVDSNKFPDKIEDVIFQKRQFQVIKNGAFDKAGWSISDESFRVAYEEYSGERLNTEILYFRTDEYGTGTPAFKYGNHYFSK